MDEKADDIFSECQEETGAMHVLDLPYDISLHVFSFLDVQERLRCTIVCKDWRDTILSSPLWGTVCPVQWGRGFWGNKGYPYPTEEEKGEKLPYKKTNLRLWLTSKRFFKLKGCVEDEVWFFRTLIKEYNVLKGFIGQTLPHIGYGIHKCDLSTSNIMGDFMLNTLLIQCPNITHLDVSYTGISSSAFEGLWEYDACAKLQHLNMTCCYDLTDKSIRNLIQCWYFVLPPGWKSGQTIKRSLDIPEVEVDLNETCRSLSDAVDNGLDPFNLEPSAVLCDTETKIKIPCFVGKREVAGLRHLSLSGCTRLTDESLYYLADCGDVLKKLSFLDVSGNNSFTSQGLKDLVQACSSLKPEGLYYCESVINGPFKYMANGCSNLQSSTRPCCIPLE